MLNRRADFSRLNKLELLHHRCPNTARMSEGTLPYIGSRISLISKSEIRYEGTLYTINTQESTVALQNGEWKFIGGE